MSKQADTIHKNSTSHIADNVYYYANIYSQRLVSWRQNMHK